MSQSASSNWVKLHEMSKYLEYLEEKPMRCKRIAKMIMKLTQIEMVRPQNEKLKKPTVKVISNERRATCGKNDGQC